MYLIYQDSDGSWVLRLSYRQLKKCFRYKTYYKALQAVELLMLHKNKFDTNNRFLRERFFKAA